MIEVENLTKMYGDKLAVDNISFKIKKGSIVGFLGKNGAGKSTTMNMITGYISATSGTARINGYDILKNPREVKKCIGYLPEKPPIYQEMTVDEYLKFVCAIKDVKSSAISGHIDEIAQLVKLTDVMKRRIGNLSKGYQQRVGMAQALVGNPEVLILDEPTVGLDPRQIIEIRRMIRALGKKHTIILSSHILPEVADTCEQVIIINEGKIVAQDTLANLQEGIQESANMIVRVAGSESAATKIIRSLSGVQYVEGLGTKEKDTVDLVVESVKGTDIRRAMFNAMAKANMPILMIKYVDVTLEDIFLKLTGTEREV
ncbi:MAG: ABC transporter ATP-binding protein [Clostridia bacterium]|jgi:ABC-2 type transport system ATP-binding protein|nr:ABC transporter ATP-binding protein [Clostridia bacterium]